MTSNVLPFVAAGSANTVGTNRFSRNVNSVAASLLIDRPDWELETSKRLSLLLGLAEGWDGFNALPLDIASAMFGLKLLNHLLPSEAQAPLLSPTNYGGLQFEWYVGERELEIEIEAPYQVKVLFKDNETGEELEQAFDYEYGELRNLVFRTLGLRNWQEDASTAA